MKLKDKLIVTGIVLVGIGGISYGNGIGSTSQETHTYQGYNVVEGQNRLVFDDKPRDLRSCHEEPDLKIVGNPDDFEIGKNYELTLGKKRMPGLSRVLVNSEEIVKE
jgi:hypothetical protein